MSKATKAITFENGYYWVSNSETSRTGFVTKREAKAYANRYSFTLGYLAIALLGVSALVQIVVVVAKIIS